MPNPVRRERTPDEARRVAGMHADDAYDALNRDYEGTAAAVAADVQASAVEAIAHALLAIEARLDVMAQGVNR